jgi:hypothetical protein
MFLFNDQAGQAILASAEIMAGSGQPKQRYCCMAEKLVVHSSTGLNEMPGWPRKLIILAFQPDI